MTVTSMTTFFFFLSILYQTNSIHKICVIHYRTPNRTVTNILIEIMVNKFEKSNLELSSFSEYHFVFFHCTFVATLITVHCVYLNIFITNARTAKYKNTKQKEEKTVMIFACARANKNFNVNVTRLFLSFCFSHLIFFYSAIKMV